MGVLAWSGCRSGAECKMSSESGHNFNVEAAGIGLWDITEKSERQFLSENSEKLCCHQTR